MPYPNEHAARIKNPDRFVPNSFRSKDLKTGIRIIIGKLKGEDTMTTQAYRFSVENFTVTQAKQWLKDHNILSFTFEPAYNDSTDTLAHVGILGMHWGHRKDDNLGGNFRTGRKNPSGTGVRGGVPKKISEMSNKELKNATARMKLVGEYKKAVYPGKSSARKKITDMSNAELNLLVKRAALYKSHGVFAALKFNDINKMSIKQVEAKIKRTTLEKEYRKVKMHEIDDIKRTVNYIMSIKF